MSQADPLIRNISDTALWAAVYRARESETKRPLFRDRLAKRLAGERGEQIAQALEMGQPRDWAWAVRTYLFDQFISESVQRGVDLVVNLAAGLDARPYRMDLPASLTWVEVDLPEILAYKADLLRGEAAACAVETVALDLADREARRAVFGRLNEKGTQGLAVTEGLLIYLSGDEVAALAQDLAACPRLRRWVLDLASPGLLKMLQQTSGVRLSEASAPLKFGPAQGPDFFRPYGWNPVDVRSLLKTAAHVRRVPGWLRLMALLPESSGAQGDRPWGGVCLLEQA